MSLRLRQLVGLVRGEKEVITRCMHGRLDRQLPTRIPWQHAPPLLDAVVLRGSLYAGRKPIR